MGKRKWSKPEIFLISHDGKKIPLTEATENEMNLEKEVTGLVLDPQAERETRERTIP